MRLGPDAGLSVDCAEPDAGVLGRPGISAEESRAAPAAEDLLPAALGKPDAQLLPPCRIRTEPGPARALADAAVPLLRWQRVQWQ